MKQNPRPSTGRDPQSCDNTFSSRASVQQEECTRGGGGGPGNGLGPWISSGSAMNTLQVASHDDHEGGGILVLPPSSPSAAAATTRSAVVQQHQNTHDGSFCSEQGVPDKRRRVLKAIKEAILVSEAPRTGDDDISEHEKASSRPTDRK